MSDETMAEAGRASEPDDHSAAERAPRAEPEPATTNTTPAGPSGSATAAEPVAPDRRGEGDGSRPTDAAEDDANDEGGERAPALGPDGLPRKRRRRGSRGGR